MAATYVIIAAFITVTGLVSAQLPFGTLPEYGFGDIGFGHPGEVGAFTHSFGPFPGGPFPFNGMAHPMSWPASVGGNTHTVTHTSGVAVPHHVGAHVGGGTTTKTVTVTHHPGTHVTTIHHPTSSIATHTQHVNYGAGFPGTSPLLPVNYGPGPYPGEPFPHYGMSHPMPWGSPFGGVGGTTHTVTHTGAGVLHHPSTHGGSTTTKTVTVTNHPTTHVTNIHHPASSVTTHTQHMNYGAGFPGAAPFLPMGYGPGPYPVEPFPYGMSHPMPWPTTFGGLGGTTHTVTHSPGGGVTHHVGTHTGSTTTKTVTVTQHPSTHVATIHHPASTVTSHVNLGAGFPGAFGYGHGFLAPPAFTQHQTISHMNPGLGFVQGFPGAIPAGLYEQSMFPGLGYGFDSLHGNFNPAIGTSGMPFPYIGTGIHDGTVGLSTVHTVHHHPGGVTSSLYPGAFNPYTYGTTTTVTKHTKTTTRKSDSSKKN